MKTNLTFTKWLALAALLSLNLSTGFAQGTTAFTYQGQLHDGGTNANGTYTMIFKLYVSATSTSQADQIGSAITTSATLANGLFSVNLDFGAGAFNGSARWLDITVTNGPDTQTLSPRVQVLPTPYAQFAAVAASVTNGAITASEIANGAIGSAQLAPNLTVSGTLAISTNLQIGGTNWNVNMGNVFAPNGNLVFSNSLIFSANGLPYLNLMTVPGIGPAVYAPTFFTLGEVCQGKLKVNDTNGNSMAEIDSGGNISANGNIIAKGGLGVLDTNGNSMVSIDSGGNINANGNITTSGNISAANFPTSGVALLAGGVPNGMQEFTPAGTYSFTVPTNISRLLVELWGAGGGGGEGISISGGGGGGGAYSRAIINVTGGTTLTVKVGASGVGGGWSNNGFWDAADGGDSSIALTNGTLLILSGGGKGGKGQDGYFSPGGAGGTPDPNAAIGRAGTSGVTGIANNSAASGGGSIICPLYNYYAIHDDYLPGNTIQNTPGNGGDASGECWSGSVQGYSGQDGYIFIQW